MNVDSVTGNLEIKTDVLSRLLIRNSKIDMKDGISRTLSR